MEYINGKRILIEDECYNFINTLVLLYRFNRYKGKCATQLTSENLIPCYLEFFSDPRHLQYTRAMIKLDMKRKLCYSGGFNDLLKVLSTASNRELYHFLTRCIWRTIYRNLPNLKGNGYLLDYETRIKFQTELRTIIGYSNVVTGVR